MFILEMELVRFRIAHLSLKERIGIRASPPEDYASCSFSIYFANDALNRQTSS